MSYVMSSIIKFLIKVDIIILRYIYFNKIKIILSVLHSNMILWFVWKVLEVIFVLSCIWFTICFISLFFVSQYEWERFWVKIIGFEKKYIWNKLFPQEPKYPIWVIGRGVYALNLIKALDSKYEINLITTDKDDFAGWSKKVNKVICKKSYKDHYDYLYLCDIYDIVQQDMIIAVGEETVILEHELNSNNEPGRQANMYGHTKFNKNKKIYHDKQNFMKLLKEIKLPCLEYHENYTVILKCDGDYLLKPIYSRGGQGQKKIKFQSEEYTVPHNYILQKYIHDARECSTFLLADEGQIKIFLTYDVNDMVDGYGTKRSLIENNETYEYCKQIVAKLNYSGFLGMDYINNDGIWYPIDFNPRITNGIGFFKENTFDPLKMKCELDARTTISTIPYLLTTGKVFDIFRYKSDYFDMYDIMPGISVTFQLIWAIIESIYYLTNTKQYIKNKLLEKIVTCDKVC